MKAKTAKAKGNRFEQYVVEILNETIDPKARRTRASGAGFDKGDIYCPGLNWVIEAKNHKHLSILDWIEQNNKENAGEHNTAIVMFHNPKSPQTVMDAYCVVSLSDLIAIYQTGGNVVNIDKTDNKQLNYKLERLNTSIKDVLKEIKRDE